jgi:hypothetical protein
MGFVPVKRSTEPISLFYERPDQTLPVIEFAPGESNQKKLRRGVIFAVARTVTGGPEYSGRGGVQLATLVAGRSLWAVCREPQDQGCLGEAVKLIGDSGWVAIVGISDQLGAVEWIVERLLSKDAGGSVLQLESRLASVDHFNCSFCQPRFKH